MVGLRLYCFVLPINKLRQSNRKVVGQGNPTTRFWARGNPTRRLWTQYVSDNPIERLWARGIQLGCCRPNMCFVYVLLCGIWRNSLSFSLRFKFYVSGTLDDRGKTNVWSCTSFWFYDFGIWDTLICDYYFSERFVSNYDFWLNFKNKKFTLIFEILHNFAKHSPMVLVKRMQFL